MASPVLVDDDNSTIQYSGGWALIIDASASNTQYNQTAHLSRTIGSTASFVFNGTNVQVYGLFGPNSSTTSSYKLDTAPSVTYSAPNTTATEYKQKYYDSSLLTDGQHQLTIELTAGDWLWLDYLQYTPSQNQSSSSTSTAPSTTISASSPPSSSSSSSSSTRDAVIGGVIGGVALAAVILFSFLFYRLKTRKLEASLKAPLADSSRRDAVMPFVTSNTFTSAPLATTHNTPSYTSSYARIPSDGPSQAPDSMLSAPFNTLGPNIPVSQKSRQQGRVDAAAEPQSARFSETEPPPNYAP